MKRLVYKLETFKNRKEVKHIIIMVIAMIYIFFILCNISSLVENYFQKILSRPQKSHSPFLLTIPLSACTPFLLSIPVKRGGGGPCLCKNLSFPKKFLTELVHLWGLPVVKMCSIFFELNLTLFTRVIAPNPPQNGPDWVLNQKK